MALVPREHGAYVELAVPMLTALSLGRPTLAGGAWAVAGVAAFLAHQPALVLIGRRNNHARGVHARTAAIVLVAFSFVSIVAALAAFVLSPPAVEIAACVPAALVLASALFVVRRAEKTALGEIVVGAALPSLALPVAAASGVTLATALFVWLVFAAGFIASTLGVRAVIQDARGTLSRRASVARAAGAASVLVAAIALHALRVAPSFVPVAAAPLVLFSIVLHAAPPSPKHLRTLGWLLVGASLMTGAIVRGLA
jgi:hypothetical protein